MDFRIADTFTGGLAKLSGEEQRSVKTAAFDLQMNLASPGMSFHKLDKARDKLIESRDWGAVTERVQELLPYVPLWYEGQFSAMRVGISGYAPASDGNWDGLATITKQGVQP